MRAEAGHPHSAAGIRHRAGQPCPASGADGEYFPSRREELSGRVKFQALNPAASLFKPGWPWGFWNLPWRFHVFLCFTCLVVQILPGQRPRAVPYVCLLFAQLVVPG